MSEPYGAPAPGGDPPPVPPEEAGPAAPPGGAAPVAAPLMVQAPAAPAQAGPQRWLWCPNCLLVSEKEGVCPSCAQPFRDTPPWGIPYGPYSPPPPPAARKGRLLTGIVVTSLVIAAVLAGIAVLFRTGNPLGGSGEQTNDKATTAFSVPSLGGTLSLPASWVSDPEVAQTIKDLATSLATGPVRTEVSVRRGRSTFAIVTGETDDTASVMNYTRNETPKTTTNSDGSILEEAASKSMQIAGYEAIVDDYVSRDAEGKLVGMVRLYVVDSKDHFVVIRLVTPAERGDADVTTIEQALAALG